VLLGELGFFISAGCGYWSATVLQLFPICWYNVRSKFYRITLSSPLFLIIFTLTKIVIMDKVSIRIIILFEFFCY
jgi:hypothetical protein